MADGVELATGYISLVPSAAGIASKLTTELGAPLEQAAVQSGANVTNALSGGAQSGFSKIGSAFKAALPAAVIIGVGAGLASLGSDFKDAYNSIRVETGKTGDALQGLNDDFKTVLSQRPDSMNDVATAIGKLNVGLGLTGPSLDAMATQVLRLSSITKTDLGANLDAVTSVMNNFGIAASDQGGKLDEMFRASQATGISVSDLASQMASSGALTRSAGLTFEDSAAFLGLLSKAGIDSSSAMVAFRKSISEGAKEGKSASDVFHSTWDAIMAAKTPIEAQSIAIQTFGSRAGAMADLIRSGAISYQDLSDKIANGGDTIAQAAADTAGLSGKWGIFLNSMKVAFEPIAIATITGAIAAMTAIQPYLLTFAGWVATAASAVGSFFDAVPAAKFAAIGAALAAFLVPAVMALAGGLSFLVSPVVLIAAGIAALGAAAIYAWNNFSGFRDFILGVLDDITTAFDAFMGSFENAGATIATGGWVGVVEQAGQIVRRAFDQIATGARELVDFWVPRLQNMWAGVVNYWQGTIVPFITGTIVPLWQEKLRPALQRVGDFIRANLVPILAGLAFAVGLIFAPVTTLIAGFAIAYARSETFRNAVDGLARWLREHVPAAMETVRSATEKAWAWIQANVIPVVTAIAAGVRDRFEELVTWVSERWDKISKAIETVLTAIKIQIAIFVGPILLIWNQFHEQIMGAVSAAWTYIQRIVDDAVNIVSSVIDLFLSILSGDWGAAWDDIVNIVSSVWDQMSALIDLGIALLQQLVSAGVQALASLWSIAWDGIKQVPGLAFDFIIAAVTLWPDLLAAAGSGLWDWIGDGFAAIASGVIDGLNTLISEIDSFQIHISSPGLSVAGHDVIPDWSYDWNGAGIPWIPNPFSSGSSSDAGSRGRAFDDGGWVFGTGPATVHDGEFVLSNAMLAGAQPIPASIAGAITQGGRSGVKVDANYTLQGLLPEQALDLANQHLAWLVAGVAS